MTKKEFISTISWDEIDSKYNWVAVDADGDVYLFEDKPLQDLWYKQHTPKGFSSWEFFSSISPIENWEKFVFIRPKNNKK